MASCLRNSSWSRCRGKEKGEGELAEGNTRCGSVLAQYLSQNQSKSGSSSHRGVWIEWGAQGYVGGSMSKGEAVPAVWTRPESSWKMGYRSRSWSGRSHLLHRQRKSYQANIQSLTAECAVSRVESLWLTRAPAISRPVDPQTKNRRYQK